LAKPVQKLLVVDETKGKARACPLLSA